MAATNPELVSKIKELRSQGMTYREIATTAKCAISTVYFHCSSEEQRENLRSHFRTKRLQETSESKKAKRRKYAMQTKIKSFHRKPGNKGYEPSSFSPEELLDQCGETCYLTGRALDLKDETSYRLDHIQPRSKGGDNTLQNCGLTCTEANFAKHDLSVEEFIQLCKEVLEHNGYKVAPLNITETKESQ